jgi:transposase-like protein
MAPGRIYLGRGKVTYYLNGAKLGETDELTGIMENSGGKLGIGYYWGTNSKFFRGELSNLRIYDRALTEKEVQIICDRPNSLDAEMIGMTDRNEHRINKSGVLDIPYLNNSPVIDGAINKGEWSSAQQHVKILSVNNQDGKKQKPTNKTNVYIGHTQKRIFVAFICYEKNMAGLKADISALEARDTNLWTDDCVEILIDPLASGSDFYHFIINANGILYDALNGDNSWDSNIKIAATKYQDRWIIELSIPFSDFGYTPTGDELWRGNFCREQKRRHENSSLFPATKFINPLSFGPMMFAKPTMVDNTVNVTITQLWDKEKPAIVISAQNTNTVEHTIQTEIINNANGNIYFHTLEKNTLAPDENKIITIPYKTATEKQNINLLISDLNSDSVIYTNQFQLLATEQNSGFSKKVWNIPDPLYLELLSDIPMTLKNEGALCWIPAVVFSKMRIIAKQFGMPYKYESIYRLYAENKLRAFTQYSTLIRKKYNRIQLSTQSGMKNVILADAKKYSAGKIPFGKRYKQPWPPDPVARNAANRTITEALQNHQNVIWGAFLGDEVEKHIFKTGIEFLNKYSADEYPYVHKANQEIKNKYGYGKFGIPESEHDKNPFCWIAYRRWVNKQLIDMHAQLYKTVKQIAPDMKVIGNDAVAFLNPYNYRDMQCDIICQQLYPARNANRARFGFLTKLNVDLSGHKDFWPCVHTENYAANFTHKEVLELMSQVVRNGGTGFQFWPVDQVNNLNKKGALYFDGYAAPERWKLQMAIVKELGNINRLKFPNPDFAILFSTDSYASMPYGQESYETESAYTLLGPVARSYFTFIDDYFVEDTPEQLSQYKVIYVPKGKYMRKTVASNLVEYVNTGGILIAGDPDIFSFCSDGTSMKNIAEKLFGITMKSEKQQTHIKYKKYIMPVYAHSYALELNDSNIITIASYSDGSPAIIEHEYGQGKAIFFAANPFTLKSITNKGWKKFFVLLQKKYGLKTGYDIWRFKFPESLIPIEPEPPKEKCITNNNLVWRRNKALKLYNNDTEGCYYYSLLPESKPEQTGVQEKYLFKDGDLTDRTKAPTTGNVDLGKGNVSDWIVSWKKTDAFNITFDFKKATPLSKAVLCYSGQLPNVSLYGSNDDKNWTDLKISLPKQNYTDDVPEKIINGISGNFRFLQIQFGERDPHKSFALAEIEVWAKGK